MKLRRNQDSVKAAGTPQLRARRDLLLIGILVLIGCFVILLDPDRAFEWIVRHEQVQIDEFLTAIVLIGSGFAIFSWRRWTDLNRQVIEYKRLQNELSTLNREAILMAETDDLLQSCLSTEEAYKVAIRHFEMQFPAVSGAIFTFAHVQDSAELAASWGGPAIAQTVFPGKDCWALRRGRVNLSYASDPKLACAHIGSPMPACGMCVPMMAQGETLGVLYLQTVEDAGGFSEHQQRIIKTVAEHLALAVANLNLRETLRTQSIRDPLTGLFNRRYMEEFLEREMRRALRKETALTVLMVDLDHFKRFNDTYGHEAGDAVLRELARVFQAQLRAEDIASRYGGEEFTLILPEMGREAARECAERLRTAVKAIRIQHYGQVLEGLTLSIGGACYPQDGAAVEPLMRAADAALYYAKEHGRDQAVMSS